MQNALWLAGRTRRIQNKKRVFGIDFGRRAIRGCCLADLVIPDVAGIVPRNVLAGVLDDNKLFDGFDTGMRKRFVRIAFQRHTAPTTKTFIRCDDNLRTAIFNAAGQCFGRKAAKYDGMDRTDARAGQHRNRCGRDHRQINDNAVALAHTHRFKCVGKPADTFMQVFIGDMFGNGRIVAFENDRGLITAFCQMTIKAVGRNVQRTVFIPFDIKVLGVKADILDLGKRLDPVDAFAMFAPEAFGVFDRLLVHGVVFCLVDQRALRDVVGYGINVRRHMWPLVRFLLSVRSHRLPAR